MTDNPGNGDEVIARVETELDIAAFIASIDALKENIATIGESARAAFEAGDSAAQEFIGSLRGIYDQVDKAPTESITDWAARIKDVDAEVQKLTSDYRELNQAQADAAQAGNAYNQGEFINERAAGYGVSGGMIGPAEATGEGGGGTPPSLFGLARGARGLGQLTGNTELGSGVASALYITQAAEQLSALNEALIASGGILPGLTEGMVALGIPMAGLLSVVVPVAAGIAAVAAVLAIYNEELKGSEEALHQAIAAYHVYIEAVQTETTHGLQTKLAAASDQGAGADEEVAKLKREAAIAQRDAFNQGGLLELVALQHSQGFLDLSKSLEDAEKAAKKAHAEIDGYSQALTDPKVKANDAAEAALQQTKDEAALKAQLAADNKLSTAAILEQKTALEGDIETRKRNNAELAAAVGIGVVSGASAESLQKLNDAVTENQKAIEIDQERIDNFNNVAYGLADASETAAAALKLQTEITKDHIAFVEQGNKLRESGTPDQFASARLGIVGKIKGAETEIDTLQQQGLVTTDQINRVAELKAQIEEYNNQLAELDANVKPIVDARDALATMEAAQDDFAKKQKSLQDQLQLQSDQARAKEAQAEEQYQIGSLQDTYQRTKIKTDESRKEVELTQQTADRILDIQTKLTNQENQLTKDFGRQQEDDITKANEQQAKLIRGAQYQAREDEIAHVSRLREIRTVDRTDEQRALLDRNFLKLFEDRQAKTKAIQDENDSYAEREAKLSRHLQDQENEQAIALANEQKAQRLAYQRKFEDLQQRAAQEEVQVNLNEERKRALLRQSEQEQLQDLTTNEKYKTDLLRQSLQNELTLYGQAEQAKLTIAQQTTAAIIADAQAQLNAAFAANPGAVGSTGGSVIGGGGGTGYQYADGGNFNANQSFLMSEEVPESLRFGNRGYNVNGAAMVYPLQGGSVTPIGGGGDKVFAPVINLYGTQAEPLTAEMIQSAVMDVWEDINNDND